MAFQRKVEKKAQPTLTVPSLYGSHASMIEENCTDIGGIALGEVCLRDEKGTYWTPADRLDTGLADPRRYDSSRVIETPNVKAVVKK